MVELHPYATSKVWVLRSILPINFFTHLTQSTFSPPFSQAPPADAKVAGQLTKFEKNQIYQAELLESIKARTGKTGILNSLQSSPTDIDTAPAAKIGPLKFGGSIEKTKVETPASTPTPNPAVPATVTPPKPVAAAPASFSSYTAPVAAKTTAAAAAPAAGGGKYDSFNY